MGSLRTTETRQQRLIVDEGKLYLVQSLKL